MIERGSGKIMNVASTAGFQPGPLMAVYYATKAYVISFSEALANELKHSGITVTCFCPGATDTGFQARAGMEDSRLFKKLGAMDVKTVARDGYRGMMKGRTLVIFGPTELAHRRVCALRSAQDGDSRFAVGGRENRVGR